MSAPTLTRDLAWMIAQDRANAQMRAAGRSKWSRDDYELAIETFDRLWPEEKDYRPSRTAQTLIDLDNLEDLPSVVCALSKQLDQLEADKEHNGECAELWRGVVRKLLAGDLGTLTEEEQRLVGWVRRELAVATVLCRCGDPRNRHAAYSSGTSCADCDCGAYDGPPILPEDFGKLSESAAPIPSWIADAIRSFGFGQGQGQHIHHVDGDPTNNDLDNLEVRTGYTDVDPERKGRES